MADLGFLPAVTRLLDQTPAGGQRMFFSATLDRGVGQLVTRYVTSPALHAVPEAAESTPAEHSILVLRAEDKVPVAAEIAGRPGRTLFFVRTKHGADRLAKQLSRAGVRRRGHPRQPQPEPAPARARRVRGRAPPGARGHRRRRPRHPRRRRGPSRAVRPAGGPQGLPAPLRPHGPGRRLRPGRRAGRARTVPRPAADAYRSRNHRRQARRRPRPPRGPRARDLGHPGPARRSRPYADQHAADQHAADQHARKQRHVNGTGQHEQWCRAEGQDAQPPPAA